MKKNKITVDDLIERIPNKYELAIACGKIAKQKFLEGVPKHEIMDLVFEEILDDKISVEE